MSAFGVGIPIELVSISGAESPFLCNTEPSAVRVVREFYNPFTFINAACIKQNSVAAKSTMG